MVPSDGIATKPQPAPSSATLGTLSPQERTWLEQGKGLLVRVWVRRIWTLEVSLVRGRGLTTDLSASRAVQEIPIVAIVSSAGPRNAAPGGHPRFGARAGLQWVDGSYVVGLPFTLCLHVRTQDLFGHLAHRLLAALVDERLGVELLADAEGIAAG